MRTVSKGSGFPSKAARRLGAIAVALSMLTSSGCEAEPPPGDPLLMWDTVEVERRVISSDVAGETDQMVRWSLSAEPLLEIGEGGRDGNHIFASIRSAAILQSGVIVVADGMGSELVFFSPDGRRLATSGGAGGGPGEFQLLWWVGECAPDRVFAYDARNARVSIFSPEGEFLDAFNLVAPGGVPVSDPNCSSHGLFAAPGFPAWREQMVPGRFISRAPLFVMDPSSGSADTIVHNFPSSEFIGRATEPMAPPFNRSTLLGAWGDRIYVAFSGRYEIGVLSRTGEPVEVFGLELIPRPVQDADAQGMIDRLVGGLEGSVAQSFEQFAREHMPEVFPFLDRLLVASTGDVWIRRYLSPADDKARWDIFSVVGERYEYRGHLLIPTSLEVLDVTDQHVVGAWRSELDEGFLRLYKLEEVPVDNGA